MPLIRVSDATFKRLEALAKGFDTPGAVIDRLLDASDRESGRLAPSASEAKPEPLRRPTLVFRPADETEFKERLLRRRLAKVVLHKADGSSETQVWRAERFSRTSNLRGNLWSGYLRGWETRGITRAEFTIQDHEPKRAD